MDIRRAVIFIGLALSSYFLFLSWNNDYGQDIQLTKGVDSAWQNAADIDEPAVSSSSESGQEPDEVPVIDKNSDDAVDIPAPVLKDADQQTFIDVTTDVLHLRIDLKGGEIVQALLPAYPIAVDHQDKPFALLENSTRMVYTAQSGLLDKDGSNGQALFHAKSSHYQLADDKNTLQVVLASETVKGKVEKIFTLKRGEYLLDVTYRIHNRSTENWQGNFYAQLKRDNSKDPSAGNSMGMQSYLGAALTTSENRYEKISFDELEDAPYKSRQQGGWAAILQHYFLAAWIPDQNKAHVYNGRQARGNNLFGFYSPLTTVKPGETGEVGARLYLGPKIQDNLAEIAENLDLTIDYGWLWFIAQPLFSILKLIQSGYVNLMGMEIDLGAGVGNWGVAIILLTVLIKLAFFHLSATSYRSMANMRKFAPKMQELKERHGDNREKLGQEMMALYKKEKINPLGGCLPILVQMPVFIALYWVLMESVELRQAPFILWIKDMSVMDPYFILPLVMGASMFVQMKLNPTPPDPMKAHVMQFMPLIFTVFFLWFPAGLVLYWVVNNLLSIAQQYMITRQIESNQ